MCKVLWGIDQVKYSLVVQKKCSYRDNIQHLFLKSMALEDGNILLESSLLTYSGPTYIKKKYLHSLNK